jgi:hypothetical protein
MRTKTYDNRCYELAEVFLQDEEKLNTKEKKEHLARVIQEAIEDEIHWMKIRKEYIGT